MPMWGSFNFQDSVSPVMEQLLFFHDHIMIIMIIIMIVVGYMLYNSVYESYYEMNSKGGQEIETIWTVFPVFVLLFIAFPSIRLLYLMEDNADADITIKVSGHQWYWSYEIPEMSINEYDSYMISSGFRLLEVDNSLFLPVMSNVRVVVGASDVIHSWTIPSAGVSVDAVPGRLNQLGLFFNRVGWFSGQCSEICGANHSFMPIFLKVVMMSDFVDSV
uniref:Cytochrome c oxidase subunit 2 n=2 Tax=unclassified Mesabolivar TaxID=2625251 RepID=A0A411FER7_9ARAC|nr:cytochrome c oxidase subunit 2 [Mesabolivar sp. ITV1036I1]YP_009554249.1 cytochrome c oxidase subunit 2 [Mesabolivar sp. ITV1036I3]QBA91979.1 cytochrome c oxidase subunit 2 [Mesabolivar sp. ITV1036I1]QBA92005.1 cytochrome c oxidase subunit 2 [Mesabolivar sp. ITV1036I3]